MSDYTVNLVSRSEREARIRKSRTSSIGIEPLYEFRNGQSPLPVVQLPLDVPVYRMENFRTFTDQRKVMTKEGLPFDYFVAGQETESVQQAQHEILAELARKGVADSVVPVIDVLQREGQRRALPILISSSGVVVNGNRRLAAIRELYAADPKSSAKFAMVYCALLPEDTTAEEILDIEASLQAQPETKLDYDWIGDAQLVSKLVARHKDTARVAAQLSRGDREIKNVIQALAEADLYLKDWAKAEGEYTRVAEYGEQLFKDLPKQLEGKSAAMQNASRVIAWTLYDHRNLVPGRLYALNAAFGKQVGVVIEQLAKDLPATSLAEPSAGEAFDVEIEDDAGPVSYDEVVEVLRKSKSDTDVAETVIEAAQAAVDLARGKKSGEAALKLIGQAHTKLRSVDLSTASSSTRPTIKKQLESIKALVGVLEKKLEEIG